jgi:SAM-dependent methyltransferase
LKGQSVASVQHEEIRAFEHTGWQRAAVSYENTFARATEPYIALLLDAAGVLRGQQVLDVACGPGRLAAAAARRGASVHGLDFSAAMVGIARQTHPEITFTEGDAERMPYSDGMFHAVVSSFGMHHVPQPEKALAETKRVLRANAWVAFTVWATPEDNIAWSLVFEAVDRHGDRSGTKFPPPGALNRVDQCERALAAAGFVDTSAEIRRAEWILPSAEGLVVALSAGTVRMAALLAAQKPTAFEAIVADIDRQAARYRRGDGLAIPIAAVLARGRSPAA